MPKTKPGVGTALPKPRRRPRSSPGLDLGRHIRREPASPAGRTARTVHILLARTRRAFPGPSRRDQPVLRGQIAGPRRASVSASLKMRNPSTGPSRMMLVVEQFTEDGSGLVFWQDRSDACEPPDFALHDRQTGTRRLFVSPPCAGWSGGVGTQAPDVTRAFPYARSGGRNGSKTTTMPNSENSVRDCPRPTPP